MSTDSTYFLVITEATGTEDFEAGDTYACVYGDLDEISYIFKRALKKLTDGQEYTARFVETYGVNGEERRQVTSLTGDAELIGFVLKRKIAAEKKQQSDAPAAPAEPTVVETV